MLKPTPLRLLRRSKRVRKPLAGIAAGRRCLLAAAILAASTLAVSGCGTSAPTAESAAGADPDAPTILATTGIWADVVSNVACSGLVEVETIIPVGGDPHGFEPSLADRERIENAVLVVANGLGLEERLESTLDAAGTPVFRVAEHVRETLLYSTDIEDDHHEEEGHEDEGHEDEGHGEEGHRDEEPGDEEPGEDDHGDEEIGEEGHREGGVDPHVWLDPRRVSKVLPDLADRLIDVAGLDASAIEACLADYRAELASVDAEVAELVVTVPDSNRKLVTNHDALGYFADRYGFEVIGTVIPSPTGLAETNPARLEELAELIEEAKVKAIFAETLHSTDDADALGARIGEVAVVTLLTGALGPEGSSADTYIGFLRTNATLITEALS